MCFKTEDIFLFYFPSLIFHTWFEDFFKTINLF